MDGYGGGDRFWENLDPRSDQLGGGGRLLGGRKLDESESRCGRDEMDGATSDDQDTNKPPRKKPACLRYTPQQVQQLQALFKECPHPCNEQQIELSTRLSLKLSQVKFWFQNHHTKIRIKNDRKENSILKKENDQLRAEKMNAREGMRNLMCNNCGGAVVIGEVSSEVQHLRVENVRLKEELNRVCELSGKFLGRPISSIYHPLPPSMQISAGLDLAAGLNGFCGMNPILPKGNNNNRFRGGDVSGGMLSMSIVPHQRWSETYKT